MGPMPWPEKMRQRVSGPAESMHLAELAIDGLIHALQRIAKPMSIGGVVVGVIRIQVLPKMMPGAMRFREGRKEDVPRLPRQHPTV